MPNLALRTKQCFILAHVLCFCSDKNGLALPQLTVKSFNYFCVSHSSFINQKMIMGVNKIGIESPFSLWEKARMRGLLY